MKIKIKKDTLSPYLVNKMVGFRAFNKKINEYTLNKIEETAHDYVPRSHDPPPLTAMNIKDGYGKPGGKTASGTLQEGFYENKVHLSIYEAKSDFGYVAYDSYKGEMYAADQHNNFYKHEARYPGHKPSAGFLSIGMRLSMPELDRKYKVEYLQFLKNKGKGARL